MPIQVLLVGCNETFRDTAAQLIGRLTHHVVALSDPQSALNVLSGIQFDVLVVGALPAGTRIAAFLAAAKRLLPDLHVVGVGHIDRDRQAAAPPTLDALRRAFRVGEAPGYRYVRMTGENGLPAPVPAAP